MLDNIGLENYCYSVSSTIEKFSWLVDQHAFSYFSQTIDHKRWWFRHYSMFVQRSFSKEVDAAMEKLEKFCFR